MKDTNPNLDPATDDARAIKENTWGIIYCPIEGGKGNWRKIKKYLDEKQVDYDCVQSQDPDSVMKVAAIFTRSGYRTIVVVGGDSALNYALNGIMKTPSPTGTLPALGVIPDGLINDFAWYWKLERKNYKNTIDRLMRNNRRKVDVGMAIATLSDDHNDGNGGDKVDPTQYFLNSLNIGAVASIVNIKRETKRFLVLSLLSYLISAIVLLFQRMSFKLEFSTAGETFSQRAMTLCVGSAHGYGQTPSASPYNGQLDVSLITTPQLTQLFHGMWLLFSGRFLSHKGIKIWRTRQIEFHSLGNAPISLDGRMMPKDVTHLKVTILHEAIDFLI